MLTRQLDSDLSGKEQDMDCFAATQMASVIVPVVVSCSTALGLVIAREACAVVRETAAIRRMSTWLKAELLSWTAGAKPMYAASRN